MKHAAISSLLFFFLVNLSQAQPGFEKVYGWYEGEVLYDVKATSDGGSIACGSTQSFDPLYTDGYVVKTNASGDTLWTRVFGTDNIEAAYAVSENASGYLAAGINVPSWFISYDFYLVQYDFNGNILWEKFYGSTSVEQCRDAISDGTKIILVGNTSAFNGGDFYLITTDMQGVAQDSANFGGAGNDVPYRIIKTQDGGYVMIGYSNSTDPYFNMFVVKCDANLDLVWQKEFGTNAEDVGFDVAEDASGNLWLLGYEVLQPDSSYMVLIKTDANGNNPVYYFPGPHPGDFGYDLQLLSDGNFLITGITNVPGKGTESLLEKVNTNGDTIWTKHYGGSKNEVGFSADVDATNNILIAGETEGFGVSNVDGYIVKVNSNGDVPCPSLVSFDSDANPTCEDELVFFTNTTVSSQPYTWSVDGNNFSDQVDAAYYFSTSGNQSVELSACGISITENIVVNAKPPVDFTHFVSGNTVNFTLNPTITVQTISWNFGDGSPANTVDINPSHTYSNLGQYWIIVSVTDDHGCDSTFIKQIDLLTGVDQISKNSLNLLPNPAHDFLLLNRDEGIKYPAEVTILNPDGRALRKFLLTTSENRIDVSELTRGIYLIRLQDHSGISSVGKIEVY